MDYHKSSGESKDCLDFLKRTDSLSPLGVPDKAGVVAIVGALSIPSMEINRLLQRCWRSVTLQGGLCCLHEVSLQHLSFRTDPRSQARPKGGCLTIQTIAPLGDNH